MSHRPEGYPAVSPYLIVEDAQAVLDFAARVLGAEPLRVIRRDGGGIVHAECRIEDSVLMVGEMPGGGPVTHLHVYLADPDAAFARALAQGGTEVEPMSDKEDGDRRGGVRGPGDVVWWLARQA